VWEGLFICVAWLISVGNVTHLGYNFFAHFRDVPTYLTPRHTHTLSLTPHTLSVSLTPAHKLTLSLTPHILSLSHTPHTNSLCHSSHTHTLSLTPHTLSVSLPPLSHTLSLSLLRVTCRCIHKCKISHTYWISQPVTCRTITCWLIHYASSICMKPLTSYTHRCDALR